PNSKNTYEYSYSYAETLYFSGRFLDAGAQYEKVRDSNLDNKYAEDAAFNAVKSYEKYFDLQTQAGKYREPPLPADGKTPSAVAMKNQADLTKLGLGVKFQKADKLFNDKQYEPAAQLYVQIVDSDPKNDEADKALNNAAVAYENVKRYAAATKLYQRIVDDYP